MVGVDVGVVGVVVGVVWLLVLVLVLVVDLTKNGSQKRSINFQRFSWNYV